MKKWMSALLSLALLLTVCAGCGEKKQDQASDNIFTGITGIAPDETVLEIDGNTVPAELYCYWLVFNCGNIEYSLQNNYMYYPNLFDEEGNLKWDAEFVAGQTLSQYAKASAEDTVEFYAAVEALAAQHNITLTEEDRASIAESVASMTEELGGQEAFEQRLAQLGISQETFERINAAGCFLEHLTDLAQEEGSAIYLEPAGYNRYATYVDHILLATIDLTTREPLSEEEVAAKYATAQDLLAQLQASDDVEALFAQLADEYSEDTGRQMNPNGYIYTPGTMVSEFEDAAAALEPGEISGIVETDYGYHILLRKDLWEGLEADPEQKEELVKNYVSALVQAVMDESTDIVRSEKLDSIDAGAFYTAYNEAVAAMNAGDGEQEDGGSEDGGSENGGSENGSSENGGSENGGSEDGGQTGGDSQNGQAE